MNKFCKKCLIFKDFTEFYKDKTRKDGFTNYCKLCKDKGNQKTNLKYKEKYNKKKQEYYFKNQKKTYHDIQNWNKENPERVRKYKRKWKYENRKISNEWDRKRWLKEQNATPKWANKLLLKEIFINCPIGYEVDHIIPLNNKNMSGLNIPENLRYLPKKENTKKNNKLDSELNFELHPLDWKFYIKKEVV